MSLNLLHLLQLFPGPLKILCEDESIPSVDDLRHVMLESCTDISVRVTVILDYVSEWFATWERYGQLIPCSLTPHERDWICWDLGECTTVNQLLQKCVERSLWDLLQWLYQVQSPIFVSMPNLTLFINYSLNQGNLTVLKWLYDRGLLMLSINECVTKVCKCCTHENTHVLT